MRNVVARRLTQKSGSRRVRAYASTFDMSEASQLSRPMACGVQELQWRYVEIAVNCLDGADDPFQALQVQSGRTS